MYGLPGGGLSPKAAPKAAGLDAAPSAPPASSSAGSFGMILIHYTIIVIVY